MDVRLGKEGFLGMRSRRDCLGHLCIGTSLLFSIPSEKAHKPKLPLLYYPQPEV